jgi:membrane protease YdiL (CAAX protease family)
LTARHFAGLAVKDPFSTPISWAETTFSDIEQPARWQLLICFACAILAMLPTQIVRLYMTEPFLWLTADYGGRLLSISAILILPAGQWCLRQKGRLRVDPSEAFMWIVLFVFLFKMTPLDRILGSLMPGTALGIYPQPSGGLYLFDLTLGIALVTFQEELVFRKLAYHALRRVTASESAIVLVSSIIFTAFHWWTGIGNMIGVALFSVLAMPCYRRTGSLWPICIAHYLLDFMAFA